MLISPSHLHITSKQRSIRLLHCEGECEGEDFSFTLGCLVLTLESRALPLGMLSGDFKLTSKFDELAS